MKDELRLHHMTEWRKKITGMTIGQAEEEIKIEKIMLKRRVMSVEEQLKTRKEELALIETFDVEKELGYINTEGA